MKKLNLVLIALLFCIQSFADFKTIENSANLKQVIASAEVPVIIQFSAYWCGPCQALKKSFNTLAPQYNDSQVILGMVDAYVNSDLKSYLMGGYPTVRVFHKGKVTDKNFVGSMPDEEVQAFIESVIKDPGEEETEESYCR